MSRPPSSSSLARIRLRLWQQNLNKSLDSQLDFLHSLKPSVYDIALIQEPHIDFRGVSRSNRAFISVYPPTHTKNQRGTRSLILVNARIPTSSWSVIPIPSPDITAIEIVGDFGTVRFINIYNDCTHNEAIN
ncbi:hypothetical protein C8R46DRAFT_928113, partial [Mycena filopes]